MCKTLIMTGWGWKEYPVSAAVVLKALGGDADVVGMSRRRLPEFLEFYDGKSKRIIIIGVSLSGDEPRLAAALARLKRRNVEVVWISAIDLTDKQKEILLPILNVKVCSSGTLLEAVENALNVDASSFLPYAAEDKKNTAPVRVWQELVDAAMYFYRNYQDEESYAKAIRYLASGVCENAWDAQSRQIVAHYRRYGGRELVGKSAKMRTLKERINRIASFPDARVLILGESGTGKETVALQIHNKSDRKNEPFYAFNCASVNPSLLESRFFGHEKGAFTGADKCEMGLFELANGGTLFLDEIGELPLEAQGLLLRVLEGGRFMRMAGREEISVDVRLITATNRNLPKRVREGKFREDLYQRLNVIQLRIPSLREHKEDIRDIADGWWLQHNKSHLAEEQIAALMEYDYPGNVRELLNLLERAMVLGEEDFTALVNEHKEMNAGLTDNAASELASTPDEMDAVIRLHVRRIFDKYGQNLSKTAEALKVARNTVRRYL
ncbi:MAG: sigma-54-dependent Fis family transcriptional regulator [Kiritimatiellae bacterium]|nr:sigma-54-dependent Fis family transcriptional regulator [Kiritimatiellia bacterium]